MTEKLKAENQELEREHEKITKQKSQLENDKDQSKVTKFLWIVNSLGGFLIWKVKLSLF